MSKWEKVKNNLGEIRKSKGGFSDPVVIRDSFEQDIEVFYCTECVGELNKLFPRADYFESDASQWFQCRVCNDIKHMNELKRTSKLESFAIPSDNPYECKNIILGLDNKSDDRKSTDSQKRMKKLKESIEKEHDLDIKQELKKGNIVEIIRCGPE